jgi:hypothetical protein
LLKVVAVVIPSLVTAFLVGSDEIPPTRKSAVTMVIMRSVEDFILLAGI